VQCIIVTILASIVLSIAKLSTSSTHESSCFYEPTKTTSPILVSRFRGNLVHPDYHFIRIVDPSVSEKCKPRQFPQDAYRIDSHEYVVDIASIHQGVLLRLLSLLMLFDEQERVPATIMHTVSVPNRRRYHRH
jgi:hypothetical protein